MAELGALGLASNVLQFVEVAIKLFARARRIQKSAKGTTQEVEDLEASVSTLERTAESLRDNVQQYAAASHLTEDERALMETALECDKYTKVILGKLGKSKVTSNSRIKRGLECVKLAIRLFGHELDDNQKKLEGLQSRLLLQLATNMK
ncbi:hypothetical protein PG985_011127 [Apiospora marii]|uniref:NACHT-NTPase and P-loop NTPases N-terminal domain-containing protein n=1 Tax=Apiospora marii TaxID=335849 RepID=A0ABR1SUL8_9PEZI